MSSNEKAQLRLYRKMMPIVDSILGPASEDEEFAKEFRKERSAFYRLKKKVQGLDGSLEIVTCIGCERKRYKMVIKKGQCIHCRLNKVGRNS